jgi:hypothetical protein
MERVETLIEALELQPHSETLDQARELVHAVLEVHAIGLRAICELLQVGDGAAALQRLSHDPRIATLLALHGVSEPVALDSPGAAQGSELIPVANLMRSSRGVDS